MTKALFALGSLYITPGALAACKSFPMPPDVLLIRHMGGDWSEMTPEDQETNRRAIQGGARIFSAYKLGDIRFWVITEADRGSTTILLPEEY
jgi:hypothetical protein